MKTTELTFGAPLATGFSRMSFEDASSIARLNRGLSISSSEMTYGQAFKCRWSKIRAGISA